VPETRRLAPHTSRRVVVSLQSMAIPFLGIDILGPFPLVIRQMKYLVVAIEYFIKWIEAEPVAQITAQKVQHFVWKNIVCRFGVP